MILRDKHAFITGSSRGIGRGIALKLAENGAKVGIHYYRNESAAKDTLEAVRKRGSDGFILQTDICRPEEVSHMFKSVKKQFGKLDIFVSNARPEASEFFYPPMDITLQQWDAASDSQAKAFLIAVREASGLMPDGGRIVAITYAQGSRTGSLLPWAGMGSAKAALESIVRYFAVALAKRGITVNAISPGWTEDSVLNSLPQEVQTLIRNWHKRGWTPMGRLGTPEDIGNVVALFCSEQANWITGLRRRWRVTYDARSATGDSIRIGARTARYQRFSCTAGGPHEKQATEVVSGSGGLCVYLLAKSGGSAIRYS